MTPDRIHRRSLDRKEFVPPQTSEDLAWMLGVLSVSGRVALNKGIYLQSVEAELIEKFAMIGEELSGVPSKVYETTSKYLESGHNLIAAFNTRKLALFFGDLSRDQWTETVNNQHKWLFENEDYLKHFIAGVFDARGGIYKVDQFSENFCVRFHHTSKKGVLELCDILRKIGIENPVVTKGHRNGVDGIGIYRQSDFDYFIKNAFSRLSSGEEKIQLCKNILRLNEERKLYEKSIKREVEFEQSDKLAWLLGIMLVATSVSDRGISFKSAYPELIEKFKNLGEQIFKLPGYMSVGSELNSSKMVKFFSKKLISYLGNLKDHIQDGSYDWINSREEYLKEFISGVYDVRGHLKNSIDQEDRKHRQILISIYASSHGVNKVLEVLSFLGIDGLRVVSDRYIEIGGWQNVKMLASLIHSSVYSKEEELEFCRKMDFRINVNHIDEYREISSIYTKVLTLRERTGLSPENLITHPDLVDYNLKLSTVSAWVYGYTNPLKRNRYFRLTNLDNSGDNDV